MPPIMFSFEHDPRANAYRVCPEGKPRTRPSGASGQMTVTLRDRADVALWSTTLDPKPV